MKSKSQSNPNPPQPPRDSPPQGSVVPRWAAALLALQALTAAGVMSSRPAAAPASAAPRGSLMDRDGDDPPAAVLPNAAAQRRDQVLLLTRIADALDRTNERLDALQKQLRDGGVRVDPNPPGGPK